MVYEEVNPEMWEFKQPEDSIEGILVLAKKNIGANNSMLYTLKTLTGNKEIWGSTILDSRMSLINVGDQIKITYKGLGDAKAGKKAPKIFKVEVDKEVVNQDSTTDITKTVPM